MGSLFEKAQDFIYRNARPLDLARWRYHFENESRQDVLRALGFYQNADGGFGHALEADSWNPRSSPIQTWAAAETLREIGFFDPAYPVVGSLIHYLAGGTDFDGRLWQKTVPSNNDYPHAPWWSHPAEADDNPGASLAGFLVRAAPEGGAARALGLHVAREAIDAFLRDGALPQHTLACFVQLYEYLVKSDGAGAFPMGKFEKKLRAAVRACITQDTAQWATGYVYKPSFFISGRENAFYTDNLDLAAYECDFIRDTQLADGSWSVNWSWGAYPEEWALSKNWWKADVVLKNLLYLKRMGRL